ncbi:MAG TPA: histidine kinase N-terminal 7TM domain-containing protein [Anaerolineales bacterium]|nr:histidine kinase N-terminal 7TM domain-containing protein [Anaerolineales bacterium]
MQIQYHPYAVYLLLSALITLAASGIAWRRSAPGSFTPGWLLVAMTIWSGSYAARWIYISFDAKLVWFKIMYIGIIAVPVLFLIFALSLSHNEHWLTRRNLLLLSIEPVLSLFLLWTNDLHHLYYVSLQAVDMGGLVMLEFVQGPWYSVNLIYSYSTILCALALIVLAALRLGPIIRNQYLLILTGSMVPWITSIISELNFSQWQGLDLTPISFGVSGILFAVAVFRERFMDLIPVARSHLIETMQDGVLVLDWQNRVVDINPAMEKFLVGEPSTFIGKHAGDILGNWTEKAEPLLNGLESQTEVRAPNDPSRILDLRATPLYHRDGRLNGRLLVFREITERKDVERKLRAANSRMQSQLIEIGTLQSHLREQAIRDPLTNLFNRRYLEETLDRELARASRESYPVCIIMIDIDHFKKVNDRHGHEAGDLVLKAMADLMAGYTRRGDFACRFGGEEFVVVMPNISTDVARERASTLRETLTSLRIPYNQTQIAVTISMGIASHPANGATREAVLRAADKAMYAAKEAGRDDIRSYDQLQAMNN